MHTPDDTDPPIALAYSATPDAPHRWPLTIAALYGVTRVTYTAIRRMDDFFDWSGTGNYVGALTGWSRWTLEANRVMNDAAGLLICVAAFVALAHPVTIRWLAPGFLLMAAAQALSAARDLFWWEYGPSHWTFYSDRILQPLMFTLLYLFLAALAYLYGRQQPWPSR